MTDLGVATITHAITEAGPLQDAGVMLRSAREVPFDVTTAESWRLAFVKHVRSARTALEAAAVDVELGSFERLRAEVASLLVLVEGLHRVGLKDVVEACERAILLEIAVAHRSRIHAGALGGAHQPWHARAGNPTRNAAGPHPA